MENETKKFDTEKAVTKVKEVLNSKKTVAVLAILLVIGAIFYFKDYLVVATVNGEPISRLAVVQRLEKESGTAALDAMITEKLILSEARANNVSVSDEEVNQEIASIEEAVKAQGMTLDEALEQQGLEKSSFLESIKIQKTLQALLKDKVAVSEEEVSRYISENQMTVPAGQEAMVQEQVRSQLENQKLSQEAEAYIASLREKASIHFYLEY